MDEKTESVDPDEFQKKWDAFTVEKAGGGNRRESDSDDPPTKGYDKGDSEFGAGILPHPGEVRQLPVLVVFDGRLKNKQFTLDKQVASIGRDMAADIVVRDSKSSRHHARILYVNLSEKTQYPDCRIFDAGSTNGTFVNGKKVGPRGVLLVDKDRVQVGKTIFGYFVRDAQDLSIEDKLEKMATNDELTGLFNQTVYERVLQREIERARRYQRDLAVMLINIDHFKDLNKDHGVGAADSMLKQLSPFLTESLRSHDLVARITEESIAVIMPETPGISAQLVAERLCDQVGSMQFHFNNKDVSLTMSIGISSIDWDVETTEKLMQQAEGALLNARNQGRGKAVLHKVTKRED